MTASRPGRQIFNIVTNKTIARQRFGKHIPEVTQSTVEETPLLGSKSLSAFHRNGQDVDNSRRTVRGGGLSSIRPRVIKERSFVNSLESFVRELRVHSEVIFRSSFVLSDS
jgi:hypothetical protein